MGAAEAVASSQNPSFTRTEVCEDYELAIHLLALVQPPVQGIGNTTDAATLTADLGACPGTYSGVVAALLAKIAQNHDYHTQLRTGDTSVDDVRFAATVTECDAPGVCDGVTGSKLFPLNGGDDQHLYAHAAKSDGGDLLMEIQTLNGVDAVGDIAAAKATEVPGIGSLGGANGREWEALGERTIYDGRDRAPFTVQARDLATGTTFTLGADFVTQPTDELAHTDPRYLASSASYPDRSYGCVDTAPGSDTLFGACLTEQGRLVVWIGSWSPGSADPDIVSLTQSYLGDHLDAASQPVFLDMRGNGGGSVALATIRPPLVVVPSRGLSAQRAPRSVASACPRSSLVHRASTPGPALRARPLGAGRVTSGIIVPTLVEAVLAAGFVWAWWGGRAGLH